MDKLTAISATLFLAADVFAILSLAMPDWIVADEGGLGELLFYLLWSQSQKLNCTRIYVISRSS